LQQQNELIKLGVKLVLSKDLDFLEFADSQDAIREDFRARLKTEILNLIDLIEKDPDFANRLMEEN